MSRPVPHCSTLLQRSSTPLLCIYVSTCNCTLKILQILPPDLAQGPHDHQRSPPEGRVQTSLLWVAMCQGGGESRVSGISTDRCHSHILGMQIGHAVLMADWLFATYLGKLGRGKQHRKLGLVDRYPRPFADKTAKRPPCADHVIGTYTSRDI